MFESLRNADVYSPVYSTARADWMRTCSRLSRSQSPTQSTTQRLKRAGDDELLELKSAVAGFMVKTTWRLRLTWSVKCLQKFQRG
jgi:hypothetical protein